MDYSYNLVCVVKLSVGYIGTVWLYDWLSITQKQPFKQQMFQTVGLEVSTQKATLFEFSCSFNRYGSFAWSQNVSIKSLRKSVDNCFVVYCCWGVILSVCSRDGIANQVSHLTRGVDQLLLFVVCDWFEWFSHMQKWGRHSVSWSQCNGRFSGGFFYGCD